MTVNAARQKAYDEAGLALAQPDPDGPPLRALTWPGEWLVTAQEPAPGTHLHRGDSLKVRFRSMDGDGSAGVREPRRPLPEPDRQAAKAEPVDDPSNTTPSV
jgi:hypothetical protein